jgi:hypothetical protein
MEGGPGDGLDGGLDVGEREFASLVAGGVLHGLLKKGVEKSRCASGGLEEQGASLGVEELSVDTAVVELGVEVFAQERLRPDDDFEVAGQAREQRSVDRQFEAGKQGVVATEDQREGPAGHRFGRR